jgi:hypothetical protein
VHVLPCLPVMASLVHVGLNIIMQEGHASVCAV